MPDLQRIQTLGHAYALGKAYGLGCKMSGFAQDKEEWITVHPNGPLHTGVPALIEKATGEVLGGMGGKFNGQNISSIGEKTFQKPSASGEISPSAQKSGVAHEATSTSKNSEVEQRKAKIVKAALSQPVSDADYELCGENQTKGNIAADLERQIKYREFFNKLTKKHLSEGAEKILGVFSGISTEQLAAFIRVQKAKEQANHYPESIAGVSRGDPMDHDKANGGRPNPHFNESEGFNINCQSCVVCYDARRRGYDVEAAFNAVTDGNIPYELSKHFEAAYLDEYGFIPLSTEIYSNNKDDAKKDIESMVNSGEHCICRVKWLDSNDGHVFKVGKDEQGNFWSYDPQSGRADILDEYLQQADLNDGILNLLRTDNLAFNPSLYDGVMVGPGKEK